MIEVLMLLAVFATNILKPISKVLEDYDGLMSLAELIVEGLFLFFVLKESKMTKKSFEWMENDRKEKKDKEANRQLQEIIKFFYRIYYLYIREWYFGRKEIVFQMDDKEEIDDEKMKEIIANIQKNALPEKSEQIEYLIDRYKSSQNEIINFDKREEEILTKIIKEFVIDKFDSIMIYCERIKTKLKEKEEEKKEPISPLNKEAYLQQCDDQYITKMQQVYILKPELIKTMNIDYQILEQIYYKCMYNIKEVCIIKYDN